MEKKISKEDILSRISVQNETSFWRKHWAKIVIVLLIIIWSFFYSTMQKSKNQTKYTTTQISKRDLLIKVSATGNLEPTNSVDVGIEVSGTMEEVLVDYNDRVTKGQVLARLDTTKLLSQVNNSKASLEVSKANLKESEIAIFDAKQELERLQKLYKMTKGDYPTTQEIDKAKITYAKTQALYGAYKAKVSQSKAQLKVNEDELNKAVVVSPIDGIVLDKQIEVGQSVVASMQIPVLFILAQDLKRMQAIISVDEADIGKIEEGQSVEFSVDAYSKQTFDGKIIQVRLNSQTIDGVVTYEVVVDVNNSNLLLRPGMTLSADIITQKLIAQQSVLNSALRFTPTIKKEKTPFAPKPKAVSKKSKTQKSIWVLQDNKPVAIDVEVGLSDGVYTVIKSDALSLDTQILTGIKESKDE